MKPKFQSGLALLINPFHRIAGWQALGIGLVVMALTAVVGKINHITFSGSFYANPIITLSFQLAFVNQAINYLLLFLTMWIAGLCFSKSKLRAVDVAGTMALTRIPMLLVCIVCFLPITPASTSDAIRIIILYLICIPFMIWMAALMYNAYTVSCNLKGGKAIGSFIGAVIVAELLMQVVSSIFITYLYTHTPITNDGSAVSKESIEAADSSMIRKKAEYVVKSIELKNFDAITVYCDETMKKANQSDELKKGLEQVELLCGKFVKAEIDNLKITATGNYQVVTIPYIFEKAKISLYLTFNSKGEISGFWLR